MKVLLFELNSKSGTSVFNQILFSYLRENMVDADIVRFPLWHEPVLDAMKIFGPYARKKKKYDFVHTSSNLGNCINAEVITFHLMNAGEPHLKDLSLLKRWYWDSYMRRQEQEAVRHARIITAVSKYTAGKVKEVYGVSSEVIYNGIDTGKFKPLYLHREDLIKKLNLPPEYYDKKIIFFAGNATKRKGFDVVCAVMNILDDSYVCLTCGLRTSSGNKKIVSLGSVGYDTMPYVYNLSDVYFHPARAEGFGLTVAEAMACGKPVVCGNRTSLPELIIHGKGGLVCDVNPGDFVSAIQVLTGDPIRCKEMGEFNRAYCIEKFDYKIMGKKYEEVYSSLRNHM